MLFNFNKQINRPWFYEDDKVQNNSVRLRAEELYCIWFMRYT